MPPSTATSTYQTFMSLTTFPNTQLAPHLQRLDLKPVLPTDRGRAETPSPTATQAHHGVIPVFKVCLETDVLFFHHHPHHKSDLATTEAT